jgi:hypothetical protein
MMPHHRLSIGTVLIRVAVIGFAIAVARPAAGQAEVGISGGAVQLTVSSAPAGEDPPPAQDESTQLRYRIRTGRTVKIAVSTSCPAQRFDLRVQARSQTQGTPQGAIPLEDGAPARDLIRDLTIPGFLCFFFSCVDEATLRYTSRVRASDGTGTDAHVVRYTVLAQ